MNLPSTRAEARKIGAHKYFTGKPCKSGHVAERYTVSGTCRLCITACQAQFLRVPPGQVDPRTHLVAANVRVSAENYRQIADLAYNLTRIRYPAVRPIDIERRKGGRDAHCGMLLYTLHLHPDDVPVVRAVAASLVPKVDLTALMAHIHRRVLSHADAAACPEPEFKP